ncbi:MAG: dihydrofolate reductase [Ignavibacteriae bacterium]|nr:dihydrofolate reductase [Ignavibacteriota bacterium]NOG98755.1 dihydrofolate reductase [Ignavibacteriota bacterium]
MKKIIIAAVSLNDVIGIKGELPWKLPEDFRHFKNTTLGYPLIMGRKTYESFGKPLPGREHLVITRNKNYKVDYEQVKLFPNFDDALKFAEELNTNKVFIIGGGEIYKIGMDYADEMIISRVNMNAEGDAFFPEIDESIWEITDRKKYDEFEVNTYTRI